MSLEDVGGVGYEPAVSFGVCLRGLLFFLDVTSIDFLMQFNILSTSHMYDGSSLRVSVIITTPSSFVFQSKGWMPSWSEESRPRCYSGSGYDCRMDLPYM